MYMYLLLLSLFLTNVYMVWLIIEIILLFFFFRVINYELKSVGLVVYFFFQRVMSLLLFIRIYFFLDKLVFFILVAKLGLFPFFYWVVVVSVKVGFIGNMFVLSLQKVSIFWLFWLMLSCGLGMLYFIVYSRVFFVILNLLMVRDLWLLIVYSSIANSSIILLGVLGSHYVLLIFLYLFVILFVIYLMIKIDSYIELVVLVFFFLVIPPFLLFFIKFYIMLSLDYVLKVGFFLAIFDVVVLFYYFRLVFIKFMLMELRVLIYMMNLVIILIMVLLRNCVTMIVFY